MADITRLLASIERRSAHAKEFGHDVLFVRLEDLDALVTAISSKPVLSFYRDGIEAAASWVDQQREAYDSEHGYSDPDTGSFEFSNDAQIEYSSTLEELAEGIRALHPNADNSLIISDGYGDSPEDTDKRDD
ncbi:hypothetical protein ACVNA6_000280 [Klebsiella aerogenes]|uniref:hypothetical protein n=1 Tax=Klebsiella aerogenes TaxID=548 RepID=UPI00069AE78C|nr:hypothetical protein [Klebsiella aerogenes]UWA53721.1 hypothetical protein M5T48_15350 [Klebsiella aerogenes]